MTNKELIELAREHATYDLPYGTIMLLNDLADALELVEAEKHYNQFVAVFADDVESVIPPLDLKSGCIFPCTPDEAEMIVSSDVSHWIVHDKCYCDPIYECSVCGSEFYDKNVYYDDLCPDCGAIMDEDAEEWIDYGYEHCGR